MIDFRHWADQPIDAWRMLRVSALYIRDNLKMTLLMVFMPIALSVVVLLVLALVLGALLGMSSGFVVALLFLCVPLFGAAMSVSLQRWVILGEKPPGFWMMSFGKKELWTLLYWAWFVVIWLIILLAVSVALSMTIFDHDDGNASLLIATLISIPLFLAYYSDTFLALPRLAAGMDDAGIKFRFGSRKGFMNTPDSIRELVRGHRVRLAVAWAVLGSVAMAVAAVSGRVLGWVGDVGDSTFTRLIAIYVFCFGLTALFSIINALLYMRLGGEVPDSGAEKDDEALEKQKAKM